MKSLVVIFLISSVASAALWAQSTSSGQISGTVQDTAGGLIPGAQVSVTQTATGATRNFLYKLPSDRRTSATEIGSAPSVGIGAFHKLGVGAHWG